MARMWQPRQFDPSSARKSPAEPRRARTVTDAAMALLAQRTRRQADTWSLRDPIPGVVPRETKLAMDSAFSRLASYADGFSGISSDVGFLGYPVLAELAQIPEYRRPCEIIAKEMTRKWIKFTAVGNEDKTDKIKQLEAEFDRLQIKRAFRRAFEHDGIFGIGHIFLDTGISDDPNELRMPLTPKRQKVAIGSLKSLVNIEPIWTYPGVYNAANPLAHDFYRPPTWFVQGREVHSSRLLTFTSREVPDFLKPVYMFGGLSLTQMIKPYIDNWLRTRQSVSDIISNFSIMIFLTELGQDLNMGASQSLINRAKILNGMRDNNGLLIGDKNTEDLKNIAAPISGLDKLQAQAQEHMAAVTGIPLVKLLGVTPSGLNASSDGEMRVFYDWIESLCESVGTPQLNKLLNIVQLSLFGEIDPDISYAWQPLWTLDEKGIAEVRKTEAETADIYLQGGVISPHEQRVVLANEEDSPYAALDLTTDPETPAPTPEPGSEEDTAGMMGQEAAPPEVGRRITTKEGHRVHDQ